MGKYIIYGAGEYGSLYADYLKSRGYGDKIECFCDKNYENIKEKCGYKVFSFDEAKKLNLPFIISVSPSSGKSEVIKMLVEEGAKYYDDLHPIADEIGITYDDMNKDLVTFDHDNGFSYYFEQAENSLSTFWDKNTVFYNYFKQLDLTNVLELACGRGRHVQKYINEATSITLVDILQSNIDYCKKRFKDSKKVKYYCNNGADLREINNESLSAIFSYDAVVHFEMIDVYSYIREFQRVLKPGGLALIHHSNYHEDYRASYSTAPGGRSYMSKDLFAYIAYRNGFNIINQKIIDWGKPKLDCVSLIEKPNTLE